MAWGEWPSEKEISETDAWEFLTDASEKLLFLGVEILLPSWWLALKESSLKVKAKVKSQSNRGPSYVGLKALMDFDWRFSLNGKELTEAEFEELVNEKGGLSSSAANGSSLTQLSLNKFRS